MKCVLLASLLFAASVLCAGWRDFIQTEKNQISKDDTAFVTLDRAIAETARVEAAFAAGEATAEDRAVMRFYRFARAREIAPFYSINPAEDADAVLKYARETPSQGWNYTHRFHFAQFAFAEALETAALLDAVPVSALQPVTPFAPDAELWTDATLLESFIQSAPLHHLIEEDCPSYAPFQAVLKGASKRLRDAVALEVLSLSCRRGEEGEAISRLETFSADGNLYPAVRHAAQILLVTARFGLLSQEEDKLTVEDCQAKKQHPFPKAVESLQLLEKIVLEAKLYDLRWRAQNLMNQIRRQTVQFVHLPFTLPETLPGPRCFSISYRNTNHMTLTFQPVTRNEKHEWVKVGDPFTKEYDLPEPKDYAVCTAQIEAPFLTHGVYVITLTVPDPTFDELAEEEEEATVTISDFIVSCVAQDPVTWFAADIKTGQPIAGVELVYGETKATTDALGLAVLSVPAPDRWSDRKPFTATRQNKTIVVEPVFTSSRGNQRERTFLVYPDCTVYRPGDTVKLQVLALQPDATGRRMEAQKDFKVPVEVLGRTLTGEERTLFSQEMTFSDRGSLSFAFEVPQDFAGSMRLSLARRTVTRPLPPVLEFKPPAMEVKLEALTKDSVFGEPIAVRVRAVDASRVPLAGATATCSIRTGKTKRDEVLTLDAKGEATLSIIPEADEDESAENATARRYVTIEAKVVAKNGERCDEALFCSQVRYGYDLDLEVADWKLAKEPFEVQVTSEERPSLIGTLTVYRALYPDGKKVERGEVVYTTELNNSTRYPVTLPGGNYLVVAESGKVKQEEEIVVFPKNGDLSGITLREENGFWRWSSREDSAILFEIKPGTHDGAFTVGETMTCYVAAREPVFFLYSISTLDGTHTFKTCGGALFQVPVTPDMIGNAVIQVFGIYDGKVYTQKEEIKIVPPPELEVKALRVPDDVRPGSEQTWELTVNDPAAEMVITCYDAMCERVVPFSWPLINSTFPTFSWWRGPRLEAEWAGLLSFSYLEPIPRDPCGRSAYFGSFRGGVRMERKRALGANAVEDCDVVAESAPAPCAVQAAEYEDCDEACEDEGGAPAARMRADFSRMATWVPQKRLVDGKAVFTFTLPDTLTTWKLRALAYTPDGRSGLLEREIVATQPVMLRPYLPRFLRIGDSLKLEVALNNTTDKPITTWVELNGADRREVTLEAKGSATLAWDVSANRQAGVQRFEFTSPEDSLRVEIPVVDSRVCVEDVYPLLLKGAQPATVEMVMPTPEVVVTERWNHQPTELAFTALRSQLNFPFNCSEQRFAKLAAALMLRAGSATSSVTEAQVEEYKTKLLEMRLPDGLWPWFPGGDPDAGITAEICIGSARLKKLGLLPKELEVVIREILEKHAKKLPFAAWLYARTAWLAEWPLEKDLTDELLQKRRFAGIQEELYFTIAAQRLGLTGIAERGVERVVASMTASETWGRQWPQERTWWNWYSTPIESHVLRAEVLRNAGRIEDAEGAALWLLQNCRMTDWGTTRATSAAVDCLLHSEIAKSGSATPVVTKTTEPAAGGGRVKVTYQKNDATGLSFGSAIATYAMRAQDLPPSIVPKDQSVRMTRTYTPAKAKVGETVHVRLQIDSPQPLDRVWLQDLRPANTEPLVQTPQWNWNARAYMLPGDQGIDIFFGTLRRGTTVIEYDLKVTHEGDCPPGLATLKSMYAPDFAARCY